MQQKRDDDLIKETDIDVDLSKYLPPYAKAIAGEYTKYLNNVVRYKQDNNGRITPAVAKEMAFRTRLAMNKYEQANANAKRYVEGQGFLKDEELVRDLTSGDRTVYDLPKHNRGAFVQIGNSGEFGFLEVPDKEIPVKYDDKADRQGKPTGKVDRIGNKEWQEVRYEMLPEAVQREALQLQNNNLFRQQVLYKAGKEMMKQPNESDEDYNKRASGFIEAAAFEKAKGQGLLPYSEWKDGAPYRAPAGSGSSDKINNIALTGEIKANLPYYVKEKDKEGKEVEVKKESSQTYPFSKPIKTSKPITLPANKDMFTAADNRPLEGSFNINFKPDNIVPVKLKKDGTYKSYVLGTAIKNADKEYEEDAEKTERVLSVYVPLEMVEPFIAAENNIDDYRVRFTELTGGKTTTETPADWNKKWSSLKSGESLVGLDGKTYTKK